MDWGIKKEDLGFVIGYDYHDDAVDIWYHARILDGDQQGGYELDTRHRFPTPNPGRVLMSVYPQVLEEFKDVFEESELQYKDPV